MKKRKTDDRQRLAGKPKEQAVKQQATNEKPKTSYTFFENVYEVARLIPKGRVTSYGAIAKYLGTGRSARMVGYAMNNAHEQMPPVPSHRVVNRNGMLTGKHHFIPPGLMQELLEKEGIKVKEDTVVDFKKLLWNPQQELNI